MADDSPDQTLTSTEPEPQVKPKRAMSEKQMANFQRMKAAREESLRRKREEKAKLKEEAKEGRKRQKEDMKKLWSERAESENSDPEPEEQTI